ncbi:MAG: hypothetical protein DRG83_06845 [Deltaproteobacteria bacterium]|nr:MAG: hypothetical protein DRG83_06845 [Deltaproteobacteria bacterium]
MMQMLRARFWLALLVVSILGLSTLGIEVNLVITTLILTATIILAYKVIFRVFLPRPAYTDIAFWVLFFISIDTLSLAVLALLDLPYWERVFPHLRDTALFSKTLLCYALFTGSFVLAASVTPGRGASFPHQSRLYSPQIWLLIALALTVMKAFINHFVLGIPLIRWGFEPVEIKSYATNLSLAQMVRIFSLLQGKVIIFAVATWIIRAPSLMRARMRLIVLLPIALALLFGFTTERGQILAIAIATVVFADLVRWKGRFLTKKLIIISVILLFIANGVTNLLEGYIVAGRLPNISEWPLVRFFSFHPHPIYVGGTVISWVDTQRVDKLYGSSYIDALKGLIPSQVWGSKLPTLDRWFIHLFNPVAAELGQGMGLSPVGEGYLNFGVPGVFFEGVLLGLVVCFIRKLLLYMQWPKAFKPFLYAGILPSAAIGIYRFGFYYIIDTLLLYIIGMVVLMIVVSMLLGVIRSQKIELLPQQTTLRPPSG